MLTPVIYIHDTLQNKNSFIVCFSYVDITIKEDQFYHLLLILRFKIFMGTNIWQHNDEVVIYIIKCNWLQFNFK